MAQGVLVKTILTAEMISAGRRLLVHLDSAGTIFDVAFWLLDEDIDEWRLIMASSAVRGEGPSVLYRRVNRAVSELGLTNSLSIDMVSIVDERYPIVELLVGALGRAESVDGVRLDHATVGGVRLAGCLLYRLAPPQGISAGKPQA